VKQKKASWDRFQCVDTLFNPTSLLGLAEAGDAPLLKYFAGCLAQMSANVADIS
jgi:hypothetical protein